MFGVNDGCEAAMKAENCVFKIFTIANDLGQYSAMRESFLAAGFDQDRCEYRLFDNSKSNAHDPFEVLSTVRRESPGSYVIVCHQDIRIDRGMGFDALVQRLEHLTKIDPTWAVAGNFGVTPRLRRTGRVFDPNGTSYPGPFPQKVMSLDENFLVMPAGVPVACTPGLRGFHLYGTDICLNAASSRRSCYVIDFDLTHLSGGNSDNSHYLAAIRDLTEAWNSRFVVAVVGTPNEMVKMSRWKPVRWLLRSWKVSRFLGRTGMNQIRFPGA
jgi:hypothetical protein